MEQQILMTADEVSAEIARCVDRCEAFHRLCLTTSMRRCLDEYGEGIHADELRLMLACAYMCRTTADVLLTFAAPVDSVCAACAQLCAECIEVCTQLDFPELLASCIQCAESCNRLAGVHPKCVG